MDRSHLVRPREGWHNSICVEYKKLNAETEINLYPIRRMNACNDFLNKLLCSPH